MTAFAAAFTMGLKRKLVYARKVLGPATCSALRSAPREPVQLIIALADHFEPAIDLESGYKRVPRPEQERRLEWWSREYPKAVDRWRDDDGRPFVHTYFYPAEQYDEGLVEMIAEHCHSGWGEIEIHLHHGMSEPDTAENTARVLSDFRDRLAFRHRCLALAEGSRQPRYCFVHGNFALANSAGGQFCGVDSEMKVLAETGCYADFTLPTGVLHPAQTAKINSLYECGLPLDRTAPHRTGTDLSVGRAPRIFPLLVQGPLLADFARSRRAFRPMFETGAITEPNPMSLDRLALWKQARIHVAARPDWLFIKLHCHGMDPRQKDAVVGSRFQKFLEQLVGGAKQRKETMHFVTAREMANIILAACDGKDGNPGNYRDYRFKRFRDLPSGTEKSDSVPVGVKG
jgi:hypothetical protein